MFNKSESKMEELIKVYLASTLMAKIIFFLRLIKMVKFIIFVIKVVGLV